MHQKIWIFFFLLSQKFIVFVSLCKKAKKNRKQSFLLPRLLSSPRLLYLHELPPLSLFFPRRVASKYLLGRGERGEEGERLKAKVVLFFFLLPPPP